MDKNNLCDGVNATNHFQHEETIEEVYVEIHIRPSSPSAKTCLSQAFQQLAARKPFHQHGTNVPHESRTSHECSIVAKPRGHLSVNISCSRGCYVQDSCINVDPGQRVLPRAREVFARPKRCDGRTFVGNSGVRHTGVAQVHITRVCHL